MDDFLRRIPLFADLPESDLQRLVQLAREISIPEGSVLFTEGDPGEQAFVIQEGKVEILKTSDGRPVQLAVRGPGEVIGEMSLLESAPRFATGRALSECRLLVIAHEQLDQLLNTSPSAAKAMLHTLGNRLRTSELVLRQSDKMAQLGTLTAGIAHEINNPASAAQRGASQLQEAIGRLQANYLELSRITLSEQQRSLLADLDTLARQRALQPVDLDPLERTDREEAIEEWLEAQDISQCWELAPVLVNLGYTEDQLQPLRQQFPLAQLQIVVRWLEATYTIYSLLAEIAQGTARIGEIVAALKSYVYLDQAPLQYIDIHEGLDSTLVMLRSKLKQGIKVYREFSPGLPHVQVYASELSQVWTNIIDNAVDAMNGNGEIHIRTRQEDDWIVIEIEDNGPGIPVEIQSKVFNPFFTTKPVGKGTGLGLNISYNIIRKHGGTINLVSRTGMTCFEVRLPINRSTETDPQAGKHPLAA